MVDDDETAERRAIAKEKFQDARIRRDFIRKTCLTLMVQLLVTFGCVFYARLNEDLRLWILERSYLVLVAFVVTLICVCLLTCYSREPPCNYILLITFTGAEIVMLSYTTARYKVDSILLAFGLTAAVCFALTLFAIQTRIDFTVCYEVLVIFTLVFFIIVILAIIFPSRTTTILIGSLGALVAGLWIIFDIQTIIGGDHKYALLPDDHVAAAISIYIDIILLFASLLRLIGLDD